MTRRALEELASTLEYVSTMKPHEIDGELRETERAIGATAAHFIERACRVTQSSDR